MAVGLLIELQGADTDAYDALNREMGFPEEVPEGLLSHVAGPADGGLQIMDVWESREHFDRFVQERLMPAGQALGMPDMQPQPREFPVHNRWPQ